MTLSLQAFREKLLNSTVADALEACERWEADAQQTIAEAQAIISAARDFKGNFTKFFDPNVESPEQGGNVESDSPSDTFDPRYVPVEDAIANVLEETGPLTYRELYAALPDYPHMSIYRACKDELLPEQRLIYNRDGQEGTVSVNSNWSGIDLYEKKVRDCEPSLENSDFVRRVAATLRAYEQIYLRQRHGGKRLRANRTWAAFASRGVAKAIDMIVQNRHEDDGFSRLAEINKDLSFEAIVRDFPHLFSDGARDAASTSLSRN